MAWDDNSVIDHVIHLKCRDCCIIIYFTFEGIPRRC